MRSYAVIPPLMLDARQKRCVFYNENGALQDMEADFKVKDDAHSFLPFHLILINFCFSA